MSKDELREWIKRLAEAEGKIQVITLEKVKALSDKFGLPPKGIELAFTNRDNILSLPHSRLFSEIKG